VLGLDGHVLEVGVDVDGVLLILKLALEQHSGDTSHKYFGFLCKTLLTSFHLEGEMSPSW
jgi:hypothetical protein